MADFELIDDPQGLEPWLEQWDALAVASGRPLCAPGWMLSWLRHAAPETARLRTVIVRDDGNLLGIAPYFVDVGTRWRHDCRLLGSGLSQRIVPLARAGAEEDLARAMAEILPRSSPRPDLITFEGLPASSPWPERVRGHLRAGAGSYRTSWQEAPVVTLEGRSFEEWMGSKSSNFRSQMRRMRRKVEQQGGVVRLSGDDPAAVERDVAALARLHRGRWTPQGKSGVIDGGVERMLVDAASQLGAEHRFRLWMIDLDGEPISAQVFMAAGGEVGYWNGGWDERHADLKPSMLAIFAAVEDALRRGERRLDLGGGAQPYKLRFADADDPLEWGGLIPRASARYPVARMSMVPQQLRHVARGAFHRLPPERQARVKRLLRRG